MEKIIKKSLKQGDLEIVIGVIVLIFIVIMGGAIYIAGMTGFIPGLSNALGTNKPKDLGIDYSKVNVTSVHTRLGTVIESLPANTPKGTSAKFEGEKKAKFTVTGEEISAMANKSPWKYFPFTQVQVRINEDGTGEASGLVKIDRVFSFAKSLGYSSDEVKQQMEKYKIPFKDVAFYIKAKGDITDNKVNAEILNAEVGKIPLPQSIIKKATPDVLSAADGVIKSFPGFSIKSLTLEKGKVNFDGSVPAKQFLEAD